MALPECGYRIDNIAAGKHYCLHRLVNASQNIVPTKQCQACKARFIECSNPRPVPDEMPEPSKVVPTKPPEGPGTELKKLLARVGIQPDDCQCNRRAATMNESGPDWCEANLETIVGWLEDAARERSLPFSRFVGRQIVKLAIRRARANARFQSSPHAPAAAN